MRRILHILYDDPSNPWVGGGGAVRLREIYRRLADQFDITVLTGNFPGARDEIIDGIRYVRCGSESSYPLSRLTFGHLASREMQRFDGDALLVDFSAYTPLTLPSGRTTGVCLGMLVGDTAHQRWGPLAGRYIGDYERRMIQSTSQVSVVSRWMATKLADQISPGTEVHIVPAGVKPELFSFSREAPEHLLYYGRFDVFQKGIDTLLDAYTRLAESGFTIPLVIAGRGRGEASIRERITRDGLDRSVQLVIDPSWGELERIMSRAFFLCMPSRFEGFGMVAAEAMAAGVPVLAADVDSLPEVVGRTGCGLLLPAEDPAAWARAISDSVERGDILRQWSIEARERARSFTWDSVAELHAKFVERVIHADTFRGALERSYRLRREDG